jgi:hypothetical protein
MSGIRNRFASSRKRALSAYLSTYICAGLVWTAICAAPFVASAQDSQPNTPEIMPAPKVTPAPWPEVRPRRLTPPKAGATNRITIQIHPSAPSAPKGPAAPGGPLPAGAVTPLGAAPKVPADLQDWYWNRVPHDLAGAGPERFSAALAGLKDDGAAKLSKPTFQQVTNLANTYGTDLLIHSIGTDVSPALALAVISVESAGRRDAVSTAGAQGVMQLIPATAARFGVTDSMDASQNIRGGITYLDWLIKEFKGDVVLALAGYNAGENAVKDNHGVPPFGETRAYVPKVLAAWQVARGLCVTPPDLYSDGCVFATNAVRSAN